MKIKNKKRFVIFSILYVLGYLYLCIVCGMSSGAKISDNAVLNTMVMFSDLPITIRNMKITMFIWIILSFFLVLFIIWQTDLSGKKLNRTALIFEGINLLLNCLSDVVIESIVGGVSEGLSTLLTGFVTLSIIVGLSLAITYFVQKKNGRLNSYEAYSDIMTREEFEKWQRKKRNK